MVREEEDAISPDDREGRALKTTRDLSEATQGGRAGERGASLNCVTGGGGLGLLLSSLGASHFFAQISKIRRLLRCQKSIRASTGEAASPT